MEGKKQHPATTSEKMWDKIRDAVRHKHSAAPAEKLIQDFFHKFDLPDSRCTAYSLPGSSAPFLRIKKLDGNIAKKKLLESCKNPVDFTGSISID